MALQGWSKEPGMEHLPPRWLELIVDFLSGLRNDTVDFSRPHLKPSVTSLYPLFVFLYALLVTAGALANLAMVLSILRERLFVDQTYSFLLNSALADLAKSLLVLPITLAVLLIQNWIFGHFLCYFLPMIQDIPVHVTTLTGLLTAWDRYRHLRGPSRPRFPAFVLATGAWLMALCVALPYPFYTTYLDLGKYMQQFKGVGICTVNLMDDMQEYMPVVFFTMYALPVGGTCYYHVKIARLLEDQAASQLSLFHQNTTSPNHKFTLSSRRGGYELDLNKERRVARYLAAMAAISALCLAPLMVLRVAILNLTETYENSASFDITFIMLVWLAFLPTVTTPALYAAARMSSSTKERLRGYLRLSSKRTEPLPQVVYSARPSTALSSLSAS